MIGPNKGEVGAELHSKDGQGSHLCVMGFFSTRLPSANAIGCTAVTVDESIIQVDPEVYFVPASPTLSNTSV